MGSPLGPTLANFFLAHFEKTFMTENHDFIPLLYLRYVDDVFCVFNDMMSVTRFLDCLNKLQPNLKYIYDLGPKTFLDTQMNLNLDSLGFTTEVYRKPTNTNVILNWSAFWPEIWKIGLMTCLIAKFERNFQK